MNTTDRIGGYTRARIIETKNIESLQITDHQCIIVRKNGSQFLDLDFQKNTIVPSINSATEKGGIIYNIEIDIDLKTTSTINTMSFNKFLVILDNPVTGPMVFGTTQFPLTLTKQPITSSTASGKIGETLKFTGKQLNYPYLYIE